MKKIRIIFYAIFLLFLTSLPLTLPALAADEGPVSSETAGNITKQNDAFLKTSGISSSSSVSSIAAIIIETLLGLLGIVFIVLLVYAGFQWMTAEGNEEKVEKAKGTIVRAIIGLAIIIAAYSITYFVFNALNGAAGDGGANLPG
jgi:hypothetical protein